MVTFEEWEPVYQEILDYFSFDRREDERAALILTTLTDQDNEGDLVHLIRERDVVICGNAPGLSKELDVMDSLEGTIIAADAATDVIVAHGIIPDIIVTDLDGADDVVTDLNRRGTIVVVHAHGDNIPLLKRWIPLLTGPLVCTTQAKPFANLHNYGGFTDGDRAVYLAHALGASSIHFIGFDLDDTRVDPMKRGKLIWARRLLADIGYIL